MSAPGDPSPPPRRTNPVDWLRAPRRALMTDRPAGPPNPFEACLLVACVMQGIATILGFARPAAFHDILPTWGQVTWGVFMTVGGTAAVSGLFWPGDPVDGILVKRVGLVALAPLTIAYGLAGILTDPASRVIASLFAVAFGVACIWRTRQVSAAIKGLHGQLRGLREEWRNGGEP